MESPPITLPAPRPRVRPTLCVAAAVAAAAAVIALAVRMVPVVDSLLARQQAAPPVRYRRPEPRGGRVLLADRPAVGSARLLGRFHTESEARASAAWRTASRPALGYDLAGFADEASADEYVARRGAADAAARAAAASTPRPGPP